MHPPRRPRRRLPDRRQATEEALRLVDGNERQIAFPQPGERLAAVAVSQPGLVAELNGASRPFNLLTFVRPIGEGVPYSEAVYLGGVSNEVVDPAVVDRNITDPSYMPTNLVAYFRENPAALVEAKKASREVWP